MQFSLLSKETVIFNTLKAVTMTSLPVKGKISVKETDLDLNLTLLGGQSFRWEHVPAEAVWRGVAHNAYWQLKQSTVGITFQVNAPPTDSKALSQKKAVAHYTAMLQDYLRLDFDLATHLLEWKQAHSHFATLAAKLKAVRVLSQEPLENILSFICSQNNHIKRISTMINWLCAKYGEHIGNFDGHNAYSFPTLEALSAEKELEAALRVAKFGYRAKFIAQTVEQIQLNGGERWFKQLRQLPYLEARTELAKLPGIGLKVADCICLMSLGHLQAVPIDTHIYKIAKASYMPAELAQVKSVTPKIYDTIAQHFRNVYGDYAGWAQAVLFCSGLQQFQSKEEATEEADAPGQLPKAKKKRKS